MSTTSKTVIDVSDPVLLRIAALAHELGTPAYVVGGYVRDALMGRARTDIDITVQGDPLEFARAVANVFRQHLGDADCRQRSGCAVAMLT